MSSTLALDNIDSTNKEYTKEIDRKREREQEKQDKNKKSIQKKQKYEELLQLYEEIIIATGIDNNIREGMLKIANKFIEMENFKNFKSTISLLENNDDEYKSSYKLILNEYQKENYENVTQLIS